jgi:hypothetical protein
MLLPAFKGVDAVANLADVATGFVNPRGFVMVNEYQQSPVKDNLFSVGVIKGNFRQVHHFAFFRPSNIAWWDLWHSNKSCACITHIGNTNGIPSWDI